MANLPSQPTRSIELEIQIDAPISAVWNALTDPEKLANWFPREASGTTGKGGAVTLTWDDDCEWTTNIDVWEPDAHLRWVDSPSSGDAPEVAIDFHLEVRGGATFVRLVHSGFSASSDWDDSYEATKGGWTYFLDNLRHYLQRHPESAREMVWVRRATRRPRPEVWVTVFGPDGLHLDGQPEDLGVGDRYSGQLGSSEALAGEVRFVNAPMHFAGTVESLNDALLFVELELGKEEWHCGIWLSTYDLPAGRAAQLQGELIGFADRMFGEQTATAVHAT